MKGSIQHRFLKKLVRKGEEGFSLIELVVVVSVLAVLSAIAIPTFTCFQRKAQATAALAAMKQIQIECEINTIDTGNESTFTSSNLNSYQIQSNGSKSCNGALGTGLISAIPTDTNILPTFILASNGNELTYSFKGQTGTNFDECLSMVCLTGSGGSRDKALQAELESNSFVQKDTFFRRNESCYVLVDGPGWNDAQANAQAIGGNLVTINDEEENDWVINTYQTIGMEMGTDGRGVRHIYIGLKRGSGTGQQNINSSGHSDGWISGEDSTWRPPYWGGTGEFKNANGDVIGTNLEGHDHDGNFSALNVQRTNTGDVAMNWNDFPHHLHQGKGMAELPCNN